MIIKQLTLATLDTGTLDFGFVGENEHIKFVIKCDSVFDEYPTATASLLIKAPDNTIYPKTVEVEGYNVGWVITASDTAYPGSGQIQLTFTEDGAVVKTVIANTNVKDSLVGDDPPPDPIADWISTANQILDKVDGMTATAESLPSGDDPSVTVETVDGHYNLEFGIPAGDPGDPTEIIDDNAGVGDVTKVWSANKSATELSELKSAFNSHIVPFSIISGVIHGSFSGSSFTIDSREKGFIVYFPVVSGQKYTIVKPSATNYWRIGYSDSIPAVGTTLTNYHGTASVSSAYATYIAPVTGYLVAYLYDGDDYETFQKGVFAYEGEYNSSITVETSIAKNFINIPDDLVSVLSEVKEHSEKSTEAYDNTDSVSGMYKQNGDSTTQGYRIAILAKNVSSVTAKTRQASLDYAWPIVYMDENMNILGHETVSQASVWTTFNITAASIPNNTFYILVQRYGGDSDASTKFTVDVTREEIIPSMEDRLDALEGKQYDVIMFMGQSNMAGRGITSVAWPETAMAVEPGAGFEFRAISEPTVLHNIDETKRAFGYAENVSGKINDGTMKTGGPVPAFINAYFRATGTPVIGVSASEGGTRISQWQPDGDRLTDAINRLQTTLTFCSSNQYTVRHKYMVWCQGESDGDNGTTAEDYTTGFESMLSAMITAGIEKCFLIRIGNYNSSGSTRYKTIMDAQTEIAQNNPNVVMVSTDLAGLRDRGLMKDEFHYYQAAYNEYGAYAGTNSGFYAALGKEPTMYDTLNSDLYYSHKN